MRKTEYKSKYKELVRAGKTKEAQALLDKYRQTGSWDGKAKKKVESKPVEVVEKPVEEESIDSLSKIKGIGRKTVKDLKRIYNSLKELRIALKEDKVPLRDDIVSKLNKELN